MAGCTNTDTEVELEDGCFLGVIQVEDKAGGSSISQGKACRPWYTSVRKQAEGGRIERRVSDCEADLTVLANPMGELPSKSPTGGRNVRALVPLLRSLLGWVLPPEERDLPCMLWQVSNVLHFSELPSSQLKLKLLPNARAKQLPSVAVSLVHVVYRAILKILWTFLFKMFKNNSRIKIYFRGKKV